MDYKGFCEALIFHLLRNRELIKRIDFPLVKNDELKLLVKMLRHDQNLNPEDTGLTTVIAIANNKTSSTISFEHALDKIRICNKNHKTALDLRAQLAMIENDPFADCQTKNAEHDSAYGVALKLKNNVYPEIKGIHMNIESLDKMIDLIPKGTTTVIGGTSNTGKTMFCLGRALEWARDGKKVLFTTLELTVRKLGECCVSMVFNTAAKHMNYPEDLGRFSDEQIEAMLPDNFEFLGFNGSTNIDNLLNALKDKDFDILVLDYIQLMAIEEDRRLAIDKAVLTLREKIVSKGAILLLISQLTTEGTSVPGLNSFKESRTIGQDADLAITLHSTRESFLKEDIAKAQNPFKAVSEIDSPENLSKELFANWVVRATIVKNRQGTTGRTYLVFDRTTGNFYDPKGPLQDKINEIKQLHLKRKICQN